MVSRVIQNCTHSIISIVFRLSFTSLSKTLKKFMYKLLNTYNESINREIDPVFRIFACLQRMHDDCLI